MAARQLIAVVLAVVAVQAYGMSTPPGTLMNPYASNSFLIGNFNPIPFQNTGKYIKSDDPVDRMAVVGLVPWPVFYNWVVSLERFMSPAVGYVSWQDAISSTQKSTQLLAYQWNRNAAGDSSEPFDCSACMELMATTTANLPFLPGAINTTTGIYPQAQSGYRFIVEAADYADSDGYCQFIARYPDDIVNQAKQFYQYPSNEKGRKLLSESECADGDNADQPRQFHQLPNVSTSSERGRKLLSAAGCAGAVAGAAASAIGAAAGCVASLGIACGVSVAGGVAGVASGAAGAADACPGCFPGSATVLTPQGALRMDQLALGDLVLTSKGYENVFLFGERETHRVVRMLSIHTSSEAIRMTKDHFIPTACSGKQACYKRAEAVQPGDAIWVQTSRSGKQLQTVIRVDSVVDVGLFNPYTASGTIIVNNVVASVHSQWFLDDICETLGCVGWLHSIYQVAMIPVRAICAFVGLFGGPDAVNAVDSFFGLTYLGHNYPKLFMATLLGVPAMSAWLVVHGSSGKA